MSSPPGAPFAVRVVAVCDHEVLVQVEGELDLATVPRLADVLGRELSTGGTILLDLSRVAFMDCTGLRAILSAVHELRRNGRELKCTAPLSAQVRRLLEITGAQHAFSDSNDAAHSPLRATTRQ